MESGRLQSFAVAHDDIPDSRGYYMSLRASLDSLTPNLEHTLSETSVVRQFIPAVSPSSFRTPIMHRLHSGKGALCE